LEKLCLGCMQMKNNAPVCEHCGYDERSANLPHQLPVGFTLSNQYLVGRVLGQGGFGITYIGWDQNLSTRVAIKEYYPTGIVQRHVGWGSSVICATGESPDTFEKHKERFLREARTLAKFQNVPEVVQVRSFFSDNGTAYIVMEYVQGTTLKQHLKALGRPLKETEALKIMEPVLRALQKVHDEDLIHRDISPDNIMLPDTGGIKLIDFGTVRYVGQAGVSKSTEAVLKPGFAPIEQYNSKGKLGPWTDVYAICATFHYLLTGKVPADVHVRLEEGERLDTLYARTGISSRLISILEKGMAVRVADRIQSVGELYRLLYKEQQESAPFINETEELPSPKTAATAPKMSALRKLSVVMAGALFVAAVGFATVRLLERPRDIPAETEPSVLVTATEPSEESPRQEILPETEPQTPVYPPDAWKQNVLMEDPSYIPEDVKGDSHVFGSHILRKEICSVTFLDSLDDAPADSWDVSAAKNGSILAWTEANGSMYDLYIGAKGGVNASADVCRTLFGGYINAEHIRFQGYFHTDEASSMENMFYCCEKLTDLDLTGFCTENVTNMSGMFWKCASLQSLDLSCFDTGKVTTMGAMFSECKALRDVDTTGFSTGMVTEMVGMFYHCESVKALDLRHFDTSNVTTTGKMFYACTNLTSVDLSTWDTSKVVYMDGMFKNCPSLFDMRLGEWETDSVRNMNDFRDSWWEQSAG